MHQPTDTVDVKSPASQSLPPSSPWASLAGHIARAGMADRAALARLDPDTLQPHAIGALSRALLAAGLSPETWQPHTWPRWALIAKGIALAGHDGRGRFGDQLAQANVSETRVNRLLTARGDAFRQLLPSLLRLLASKGVSPNWRELGELVLLNASADPRDLAAVESLCLRIAGPYFSAQARRASSA